MFKLRHVEAQLGQGVRVTETALRRTILEDIGRAHQEYLLEEFPTFLVWFCQDREHRHCYHTVCGSSEAANPEELAVELFCCTKVEVGQPLRRVPSTLAWLGEDGG